MATKDRPSSTGSIKRSNTKISADGLTVLPPEPGLVKFESLGITRPTSNTDSSKATSARGRVKRSLHLAKKKELEDDILIPESSAGIHLTDNAGVSDHSLVPAIANLQLTKQDDRKDSQHTIDSESSETDSCYGDDRSYEASSSKRENSEDAVTEDQSKAPVELKGEFLKAVMDEEFEKAKELCQKILLLEPDNKTCSEFHAVICEKMKQDDENDGNGDSDPGDDETEESDESVDDDEENDDDDDDDDDDEDEGSESSEEISSDDSDDDVTLPSGPVNLIMGGLPIIPQKR